MLVEIVRFEYIELIADVRSDYSVKYFSGNSKHQSVVHFCNYLNQPAPVKRIHSILKLDEAVIRNFLGFR